jgi:hypothetical protein
LSSSSSWRMVMLAMGAEAMRFGPANHMIAMQSMQSPRPCTPLRLDSVAIS